MGFKNSDNDNVAMWKWLCKVVFLNLFKLYSGSFGQKKFGIIEFYKVEKQFFFPRAQFFMWARGLSCCYFWNSRDFFLLDSISIILWIFRLISFVELKFLCVNVIHYSKFFFGEPDCIIFGETRVGLFSRTRLQLFMEHEINCFTREVIIL